MSTAVRRRMFVCATLGVLLACAAQLAFAQSRIRVLAWSERSEPAVTYPMGINGAMVEILRNNQDMEIRAANLTDPGQGLTEDALANADVLIWAAQLRHKDVTRENAARVVRHVEQRGMGFIALHGASYSRPFQGMMTRIAASRGKRLRGVPGSWAKIENLGKAETVRVVAPDHPIALGIPAFTIPKTETYWPPFNVPAPEAKIFEGTFEDGPSGVEDGVVWTFGKGRIFYFRPGYEGVAIFLQDEVQAIITNAVRYLAHR